MNGLQEVSWRGSLEPVVLRVQAEILRAALVSASTCHPRWSTVPE